MRRVPEQFSTHTAHASDLRGVIAMVGSIVKSISSVIADIGYRLNNCFPKDGSEFLDGKIEMESGGPQILSGEDTPESAVTAPVGSIFLRSNGSTSTTLYVKESGTGNTGWVAK